MIVFQEKVPRYLRKTVLGCKTKRLYKKNHVHFKGGRERICSYKIFKENALGKEESGAPRVRENPI